MRERRTKTIKVRVTDSELTRLKARAGDRNLAPWLRNLGLAEAGEAPEPVKRARRSPPSVDPDLLREIAKIGNNLNQLARHANTLKKLEATEFLLKLAILEEKLDSLREEYRRK